jgi:hypothetical protein
MYLSDALLGHFALDEVQGGLVLANVVGHVAVGVDGQQVGVVRHQDLHQVQVAAGGGRVQRRPFFRVFGVHVGPELEQQQQHFFIVVDATLKMNRKLLFVVMKQQNELVWGVFRRLNVNPR